MEKSVAFNCRNLVLEGRWVQKASTHAVIITHPHPLYGGDMDSPVVQTIAKAYLNNGWSTLCFNFRGTGRSQGSFDDGNGEQEDVDAAIDHLSGKGFAKIELAGYSFGAWVLACRSQRPGGEHHPMRFVAPPVDFIDFSPIDRMSHLKQVVIGTRDDFASSGRLMPLTAHWNPKAQFHEIENADHFFMNHMEILQKVLESAIPENTL